LRYEDVLFSLTPGGKRVCLREAPPAKALCGGQALRLIRGQKVMLDRDLAQLYGVETRALNQAVRRNIDRFPEDFMFQLTKEEAIFWARSRSQIAILKRGKNIKYLSYAFTEHGAIMAANVLNSPRR
jgi:hypothetical protein